jgi:carboxymethylenebutenolidase
MTMSTELLSIPDVSRRGFVATSLASGFALATQPVSAQTITTESEGLEAGEVRISTSDVEIPAYRAMPAKGGPFPTVLVVQEIFGVHEHIKDLVRRLAKAGYLAVAPELYARQGDVSKLTNINELVELLYAIVLEKEQAAG